MAGEQPVIVDVRRHSEWDEGHISGATHIYLGRLPERLGEIPKEKPVVLQCKTGTRSSFAASILKKAGRTRVCNLLGGIDSWKKSWLPPRERLNLTFIIHTTKLNSCFPLV